ncbi:glycine receptor subunit alpha-3 isoform X4 [Diprion similis]|uniref:glycine receptor subunit alpha-3 isoform X4 n=1 Tax=Diprion similis TaxID=362088 RepID=UPI001EF94436|nr:glycine receptor subunit alpha-3 isoform X4 [Diprion similis]
MESGPARATLNGVCRMSASLPLVLLLVLIYAAQAQRSLEFFDLLPEDPKLYDKMRPPKKDGQATVVYFHVTVMGLDSIDENSMTYAADIFFAQTWKDNRLRLPENMTSEYRLLEVDWLKNMWRPDSFFKNAKSVTFQTMTIPNHYLWLYKDKTILYMVKLTLKLSCAMNFLIYPHDTQECKLQMESLSHTTDEMIFQWDPDVPLVVDENIELPQLQLVKNYTADCTQVYSTDTDLNQAISFSRKLYMPGGCLRTKTAAGLLSLPHLRSYLPHRNHVVGFVLDKTGSRTGESHSRSDVALDAFDAACEESGLFAPGILPQSSRRLYVCLHNIRLHGFDGILSGQHRPRRQRRSSSQTSTSSSTTKLGQWSGRHEARQDLRHSDQEVSRSATPWTNAGTKGTDAGPQHRQSIQSVFSIPVRRTERHLLDHVRQVHLTARRL